MLDFQTKQKQHVILVECIKFSFKINSKSCDFRTALLIFLSLPICARRQPHESHEICFDLSHSFLDYMKYACKIEL